MIARRSFAHVLVMVLVTSVPGICLAEEETFWIHRACTQVALGDGAGLVWCADAVTRSERGFEVSVSWRGFGLSGNSLQKDPDTGNRAMYLKDSKGRRYDHTSTAGASAEGGRIDDIHPILRGAFLFRGVPPDETSFSLHDDDQNVTLSGITLDPSSRTTPDQSAALLGHLSWTTTIQIDYREAAGPPERFRLRQGGETFELEVVGGTAPRKFLPAGVVDAFLSKLRAAPLLERKVVRRQSTDDGSGVMLVLESPNGRVSFSSPGLGARAWMAETEQSSYLVPDDTPTQALHEIDRHLGLDARTRAERALAPHLGSERAAQAWQRIAARLGEEEGLPFARRVATLLDNEDERSDADVLKALEDYLDASPSSPPDDVAAPEPSASVSSSPSDTAPEPDADREAAEGDETLLTAIREGKTATVQALLIAGADPETRTGAGESALLVAATAGRAEIVEALVEAGGDVDARGRYRRTPLMAAAAGGQGQTVAALLAAGADPNLQSIDGRTALGIAAEGQHAGVVRLLLGSHADPNIAESGGETPLMLARRPTVARALLRAGARVDVRDERGVTALMRAVTGDNAANSRDIPAADRLATVREILAAGADVAARDNGDRTALLWATKGVTGGTTYDELLPPLIEAGSDVNARDADGGTPLFYVVLRGDTEATRLLLDAGADVNARVGSRSPMDIAMRSGFTEITPLLLRAGGRR